MVSPPSPETADRFISDHLNLVEPIALALRSRLPATFETEDLLQAGRLGLVLAARSYDQAQGPEDAWARFCIRREIRNLVVGPAWIYAKYGAELKEAEAAAAPEPSVEEEPRARKLRVVIDNAKAEMNDRQRDLLDLIYEHSIGIWTIKASKLRELRPKAHWRGLGWRTVVREHENALAILRRHLEAAGIEAA